MTITKRWALTAIICTLVFGMFGGTAMGASEQYALVSEVIGIAKVSKAGGSKEILVLAGMSLHEGDKLKVEAGSSVTLKFADRDDEVVLGEHWNGTISKLRSNGDGSDTALKTWSGSMYNQVEKITDAGDTYTVETPISAMGAKGTHFTVSIDPITGLPTMFVSAGRVETSDAGRGDSALILPSQQITVYPDTPPAAGVAYVDPANIVKHADPSVIAALLKNKAAIDEENEEIVDGLSGGDRGEGTLDLSDQEALERYRSNVDNALFNIMKTAVDSGTLDERQVQEIIETANQSLSDEQRKFDLDREVPSIDRTAGIDPAAEEQREQQRRQAEQKKQQQVQQKEQKKQEVANNNAQIIQQIVQAAQELQQRNEQAQQQKQQEAVERMRESLTNEQREALEQRLNEKARQEQQQRERQGNPTPTPTPSSGDSSKSRASTTTVAALSKSTIVRGEPFTITATVRIVGSSQTVPDGTTVTFRKGSASLGTAVTSEGVATFYVTSEASLANFDATTHSVSASYAGTSSTQSSTSFPEALKVDKAQTTVTLPSSIIAAPNGPALLTATVASVSPGAGVPAGAAIELFEEGASEPIQRKQVGEDGKAVFELTAPSEESAEQYYVARLSESTNYLGSESNVSKLIASGSAAGNQTVSLFKANETADGFDVAVRLENFAGTQKLTGMQLHFISERNVEPMVVPEGQSHFNADKWSIDTTAESFRSIDGLDEDEQEVRETIYAMTVFGGGTGVEFHNEIAATLKFKKTESGDIQRFEAVYALFALEDGTTFEVDVLPFIPTY